MLSVWLFVRVSLVSPYAVFVLWYKITLWWQIINNLYELESWMELGRWDSSAYSKRVPRTNCALRVKMCVPRISSGIYFSAQVN